MRRPSCRNETLRGSGSEPARTLRAAARLGACSAALVFLWLAVLPRLAAQPSVQQHIEFLQHRQIDPSAMFYTELEAMEGVDARMGAIRREHGARFWRPGTEHRSGRRP
jgi:hypothetical protein